MNTRLLSILILLLLLSAGAFAQTFTITGTVRSEEKNEPVTGTTVALKHTTYYAVTDEQGRYRIERVKPGKYTLVVVSAEHKVSDKKILVSDKDLNIDLVAKEHIRQMDSVVVTGQKDGLGPSRLKDVDGTAIYAGKKSEVVVMENITANTATNNSRQIYSKIAGLNIWENDGAGIQLGIGGRGLSPNRTTNFNTRQNGYDMSADALGYPESYYSPPSEAIDRIEIVRGAASLQYGTQFGGMVNFKLKKPPTDKKIQVIARQTLGSWNFSNTFASAGGTVKKISYYTFYQHKSGNGWRPNSQFNVNTAYGTVTYNVTSKLSITGQYTFMDYLAHQPGGLTDAEFKQDPRQSVRNRNWFNVNWNLAAVLVDYKFNNRLKLNSRFFGLLASRSALGVLTYINRADPLTDRDYWVDHYKNFGNETRLLYHYSIGKISATALIGYRYYEGHTNRRQGKGNNGSSGNKSDFQFNSADSLSYSEYNFPNRNQALFFENIFQLTPKLSIIPGIRYEYIETVATGYYNDVRTDLAGNIIYNQRNDEHRVNKRSFILGGVGLSYEHSDATQFYANISQNYRAINFNDMRVVNPNLKVDPNLKDEKGYSADFGFRGNNAFLNYDLSFFLIHYTNRIGTTQDTLNFNVIRYRTNIADSRNLGLESFVELDFWRLLRGESVKAKVSVFSNLSLIDARYIHSKEAAFQNKKVELAPGIIFKTGLNYKIKSFSASYQFSYTGQQYTDATNAKFTLDAINGLVPAYHTMDFSLEYRFPKIFSISGSINNLANNMYFTRRADSYPGPGIIPSDGRSFFITLQAKL